jgi:glycine/D-amino acid oxidase-like deaminating enzyme
VANGDRERDGRLRVGIVGLGAAGLSAAWAAARRGVHVVGFEQADVDNQPASSGGRGKIIRYGYDDPFYAALMRETMPRWADLAALTGRSLMRLSGGFHTGADSDVATVAAAIEDAGESYEIVRPGDRRLSEFGIALPDGQSGVYEPGAGVMDTTQVRLALAEAANGAGARLREHTEVTAIEPAAGDAGPVTVHSRHRDGRMESEEFDRVIVAGGPWAFRLAPAAAPAFVVTRRFQLVFRTAAPLGDGHPHPWMDYAGPGYYGMINVASTGTAGDGHLHLAGIHQHDREQRVDDPGEADDSQIRAASIAETTDMVRRLFALSRPIDIAEVRACHYTSTPTHDFVIDDCPDKPGVVLLSACSGHGFKFTVSTGAYAASLAMGAEMPYRDRFRLRQPSPT